MTPRVVRADGCVAVIGKTPISSESYHIRNRANGRRCGACILPGSQARSLNWQRRRESSVVGDGEQSGMLMGGFFLESSGGRAGSSWNYDFYGWVIIIASS